MALQVHSNAYGSAGQKPKVTVCKKHGLRIARNGILYGKADKKCPTCKDVLSQTAQRIVLDCKVHGVSINRFGVLIDRTAGTRIKAVTNGCETCEAVVRLSRKRRATIATRSITRARYDKRMLVIESTMSLDIDDEEEDI